jgi:hypothetical protein
MTGIAAAPADVPPSVTAAVLLLARCLSQPLGLPCAPVTRILEATQAGRSRAYELMGSLSELLPTLQRSPGRPASPPAEPAAPGGTEAVARATLAYVMGHPGCVHAGRTRARYDDGFRHFVLDLRERQPALELEAFAAATHLPLGTLKDWLRTPPPTSVSESSTADEPRCSEAKGHGVTAYIETVRDVWSTWQGSFIDFCDHLQQHWRVPLGRTAIATILEAHGVRLPRRRPGRSPDEVALQDAFETFFPGAQWEGDGTPITLVLNGQPFRFNLELMVDSATDAFVGISVRDTEDAAAVVEALDDAVATTSEPPLAVVLDNRSSNHTDQVDAALGKALRIRATPGRGQNKPHVEGGFGLFFQTVPALIVSLSQGPREAARSIVQLVAQTFFRTMNHRPRRDRSGRSRVDLYGEQPTPAQIEQARARLQERMRKQERARQTQLARMRPEVRRLLDDAFARLGLDDPEQHQRLAIARYPLDDVLAGIAVFEGKLHAGSLPEDADGRYLLGIVRNLARQREGQLIAETLLRLRLKAQDRCLAGLQATHDFLLRTHSDPGALLIDLVDRALSTECCIDELFWLSASVDVIQGANGQRDTLLRRAFRRINATVSADYQRRQAAVRFLADRVVPLT